MNLFLDTNVIIGLIFCINSMHEYSKELFLRKDNYFYSQTVEVEVDGVLNRKNDEYAIFILEIINKLKKIRKTVFLSKSKIHEIIDKIDPIGKLNKDNMHFAFENFGTSLVLVKIRNWN